LHFTAAFRRDRRRFWPRVCQERHPMELDNFCLWIILIPRCTRDPNALWRLFDGMRMNYSRMINLNSNIASHQQFFAGLWVLGTGCSSCICMMHGVHCVSLVPHQDILFREFSPQGGYACTLQGSFNNTLAWNCVSYEFIHHISQHIDYRLDRWHIEA